MNSNRISFPAYHWHWHWLNKLLMGPLCQTVSTRVFVCRGIDRVMRPEQCNDATLQATSRQPGDGDRDV